MDRIAGRMSCHVPGCLRPDGHPSFHKTVEAIAAREAQSLDAVIGAALSPYREKPMPRIADDAPQKPGVAA